MLTCINKNSLEYQTLKTRSGISDFILESICRTFLDKYNRFPYLDEIPGANSESNLRELLKIDQYNGTEISRILDTTGTNSIQEANAAINNEYRDLETQITPINKEAIINITHRPTINNLNTTEVEVSKNPASYLVFNNLVTKLQDLYGINFKTVTDAELKVNWNIPDIQSVNAFVYNNNIYLNIDRCQIDAPIHELSHILIGSMRFTNPKIYQDLIQLSNRLPNYNQLIKRYPNRTRNDINEEIFVSEVSKYLSGLPSSINQLSKQLQYEIMYNVKRTLDTILMGQDSIKTISDYRLFNSSLKEITKEVRSTIMTNNFKGFINVEGSSLHRKLNNIKQDLIKQNKLQEICD